MGSEAQRTVSLGGGASSLQSDWLGHCLPPLTALSLTPLLQWFGLRAGVSCGGADRELALGPPSEFHFLFIPLLCPLGWLGLSSLLWP